MLPVESLKFLKDLSELAANATNLESVDPRVKRELVRGQIVTTPIPPAIRQHVITDLRDLPAAAQEWAFERGVCWISAERVIIKINDVDRRDFIACPLFQSALLRTLLEVARRGLMPQREFLDLLIEVLGDYITPQITSMVAMLKARTDSRQESSLGVGSGRDRGVGEFISELNADDPLPEKVSFTADLFRDLPCETMQPIECRLKYSVQPIALGLMPLPDEVELAIARALRSIAQWLRDQLPKQDDQEFPVFIGTP